MNCLLPLIRKMLYFHRFLFVIVHAYFTFNIGLDVMILIINHLWRCAPRVKWCKISKNSPNGCNNLEQGTLHTHRVSIDECWNWFEKVEYKMFCGQWHWTGEKIVVIQSQKLHKSLITRQIFLVHKTPMAVMIIVITIKFGYSIRWLVVDGVDEIIICTIYQNFSQCHHSRLSRFE